MALKSVRLCVPVRGLHSTTAASPDQSQNAPARPRPVTVGINWRVCHFVVELGATGSSLLSLPAGDHKNSIVQWLSRSNTNFSAPKISSSKPCKLVPSVSSCSYHVPPLPLHYFSLSISSEGLRQSNLWNILFLFPHIQTLDTELSLCLQGSNVVPTALCFVEWRLWLGTAQTQGTAKCAASPAARRISATLTIPAAPAMSPSAAQTRQAPGE